VRGRRRRRWWPRGRGKGRTAWKREHGDDGGGGGRAGRGGGSAWAAAGVVVAWADAWSSHDGRALSSSGPLRSPPQAMGIDRVHVELAPLAAMEDAAALACFRPFAHSAGGGGGGHAGQRRRSRWWPHGPTAAAPCEWRRRRPCRMRDGDEGNQKCIATATSGRGAYCRALIGCMQSWIPRCMRNVRI
jgi:hypothetical protein